MYVAHAPLSLTQSTLVFQKSRILVPVAETAAFI
jgi:hypothetical protein